MADWLAVTGFLLLAAMAVGMESRARLADPPLPTAADMVGMAMATKVGRLLVVLIWWWIGWHFLAR